MGDEEPALLVPERFVDAYFAERPSGFLVDPQGLLDRAARREMEEFLDYHASDSKIDLHLYVFGGDQEIPREVREEDVVERFHSEGKPSLVVFYYHGRPARTAVDLSLAVMGDGVLVEMRRALQSSIQAAQEKVSPGDQLMAFCVQMSIRLYWFEQVVGLAEGGEGLAVIAPPVDEAEVPVEQGKVVAAGKFDALWKQWSLPLGVFGGTVLISILGIVVAKLRARYRFPEFEVAGRLGGSHGAGIGAVIGFGDTTQSPSTQRAEVKDWLGGV